MSNSPGRQPRRCDCAITGSSEKRHVAPSRQQRNRQARSVSGEVLSIVFICGIVLLLRSICTERAALITVIELRIDSA